MCKNAVRSDGHDLATGINTSVLFMIAMVFTVLFGFLGLLWWTCRRERSKEARGAGFSPEGKVRWSADDDGSQ